MTSTTTHRAERLAAHGIGARVGRSHAERGAAPGEIVRRMFALQGQDLAQTLWAVGVRGRGATRADVLAAFDRGDLVRSWPMRGTLHTVAPDDLRLLLSLTGERTIRSISTRLVQRGIDGAVVGLARSSVVDLLTGGRAAPREEVLDRWRSVGIDTTAGRGYDLVLRLALEGLVAWGPTARTGQALVLLDEWAPSAGATPERDEALGTALVRWLRGRAPATVQDFAGWTKLPLGDARRARTVAADRIVETDDGLLVPVERPVPGSIATAHLLPGFDEYLLGYVDRSLVLDHPAEHVVSANGIFWPVVVVRGRVVGRWARPPGGQTTTVTAFESLTDADRRAVVAAAERHAAFLDEPVTVTFAGVVR